MKMNLTIYISLKGKQDLSNTFWGQPKLLCNFLIEIKATLRGCLSISALLLKIA
jgi:hypothetical protein